MSGKLRPTRYAHCEGHTDVCYSEDGRLLVTCGQDGEVRIFDGLDDDDCLTHSVGDQAYAVAYKAPNVVVGTDANSVQLFDAEDGVPGQVVTRFTAQPTCMHVCGNLVAAGGSDMVVRVQDTLDYKDTVLEGHTAPILSVALDPKGEYVASSSCDGSVKVWFLASQSCVKSLSEQHPRSNRFTASGTLCRLAFTPSGSHLLVPHADKITVYSRSTWVKERQFGHPDCTVVLSIVSLSPCGSLVATATAEGHISVLDHTTEALLLSVQHPKKLRITGLVWNPSSDKRELAFVDSNGQLGTVVDIVPVDYRPGQKIVQSSAATDVPSSSTAAAEFPAPPPGDDAGMDDMLAEINREDDDDFPMMDGDEDDADISLAKIKSQMGFADDEHGTYMGLPKEEVERATPTPLPPASSFLPPTATLKLPELQRCFTPSMTPEHHAQRYMLWNSVGVIKQYSTEQDNSLAVEFHDTSLHHSIHQPNNSPCYSLAALSDTVLVLGAEAASDSPSRVSVQLLSQGPADNSQDWQVDLPDGEEVIAVAASSVFVCIASDRRIARILSVGGACGDILCIPGPLVCLAAHGPYLMMLYQGGTGAGGDQQIHMMVLNTEGGSHPMGRPCPVPLSPKCFVAWAGFSDQGTAAVVDSEGLLRMLHPRYPHCWTVVLDSKEETKGRSDHHFILGVNESEGKVRSILCRGARYPPVVPPPYLSLLDFAVPVLDRGSEKGELDATVLRADMQLATLRQRGGDEGQLQETETLLQTTLIKLFALSCRGGRDTRARDLCRLMTERTLQHAARYAGKLGKSSLAESVGDCIETRRESELQQQDLSLAPLDGTLFGGSSSRASQRLSLTSSSSRLNAPSTADHTEGAQEEENTDDEDIIGPTPAAAQENPLLAAAASRHKLNLSLDTTITPPSKVNPFRRPTPSTEGLKTRLGAIDDYRPKVVTNAPILRPVLKKKSKAERCLIKNTSLKLSTQPSIMSKMTKSPITGKENKSEKNSDNLPDTALTDSSDGDKAIKDAINGAELFRDSALYRSQSAMHLWWADNEDLVRGDDADKELKQLIPKAALLYKDLSDDVKTKYKKKAGENATPKTTVNALESTPRDAPPSKTAECAKTLLTATDNKRKREEDEECTADSTETFKKPKAGSGISKLAAFAFNKE